MSSSAQEPTVPKERMSNRKKILVGGVAVLLLFGGCSALNGNDSEQENTQQQQQKEKDQAQSQLEAEKKAREDAEKKVDELESDNKTEQSQKENVPVPNEASSADEVYLSTVKSKGSHAITMTPDSTLIDIGKKTCNVLDSGTTLEELSFALLSEPSVEVSPTDIGVLLGGSIVVYCPEYQGQMNDFIEKYE